MPIAYDFLKCSANVMHRVFLCGLKLSFKWVKKSTHCSCGVNISMHTLVSLNLLAIFPIAKSVSPLGV